MNKQAKLIGVGLGPGDPELITVKGLKALQSCDVIFFPATEIKETGHTSFSWRILDKLDLKVTLKPFYIPMTGKNRIQNYTEAFASIESEVKAEHKVAVVSEGDLLFYSTFGYLFKLAQAAKIECELIPGIPAFIAAGAQGNLPIVEEDQPIKVMARPKSFEEIANEFNNTSTLVVMKMSVLKDWFRFLSTCEKPFFYIERVGTAQQFSTSDARDLEFRKIPYFSLIIFYA